MRLWISADLLDFLAAAGRPTEALAESGPLAAQLGTSESIAWISVRSVQLRLLAERGESEYAAGDSERLAAAARDTGEAQQISTGFAGAARMLVALRRHDAAHALFVELEQTSGVRGDANFAANLPELTRCALAVGDPALARRLVDGPASHADPQAWDLCGPRPARRSRRRARRCRGALHRGRGALA